MSRKVAGHFHVGKNHQDFRDRCYSSEFLLNWADRGPDDVKSSNQLCFHGGLSNKKKLVYELNMTLNKNRNNLTLPSFRRPWFIFDETLSKNSADGVNKLLERLRNSKPGNIFKSAQISDHSDIRLSVRSNSAIWLSLLRLMIPLWPLKSQEK